MDVLVTDRQRHLPPAARILKAMARRVVEIENPAAGEVDLVLGDDALLAELNGRFRRKPRPTDVLSFPAGDQGPARHLGEVVMSAERAIVQAPRYGNSVAEEVARLLVHGLLHLLGYEHDTTSGRRKMRGAERAHLERLRPWIDRLDARYRSAET